MAVCTPNLSIYEANEAARAVREASRRRGIDGRPVPQLRGRIHQAAVAPAGVIGVAATGWADGLKATSALAVFTFSALAMLTASAVYHCHSKPGAAQLHARRVDHGTILIAIAGAQTAYWTLLGPTSVAVPVLATVWLVTALGFHQKLTRLAETDSVNDWMFSVLGLSGAALVPWLAATDLMALVLVVFGGAVYLVGGWMLHRRVGNLWPQVFGYHEIWHSLVLIGVVSHFVGLLRLVSVGA